MTWINTLTYENEKSRWICLCVETGVFFTEDPKDNRAILIYRRPKSKPFKVMINFKILQQRVNAGNFQDMKDG